MISKVKANLPSVEQSYLNMVVKYISVIIIAVDETIENADSFFQKILIEEPNNKSELGFY